MKIGIEMAKPTSFIQLRDSSGSKILDSVQADYEDSFSLESFADTIAAYRKQEKQFIIARIQTYDPKMPEKAFYSYYDAFQLNKILFQTQVTLFGSKLDHMKCSDMIDMINLSGICQGD